jgi:hypothetical protein
VVFVHPKRYDMIRKREEQPARTHTMQRRYNLC